MLNVLLICSQGASTAVMCKKISEEAKKNGEDWSIRAVAYAVSGDYIPDADIILLGPQMKFMKKKVQEVAGDTPVDDIDVMAYGLMKGDLVYKQIKGILDGRK